MTQLIKTLTGVLSIRCEHTLVRDHQCFSLASGACDFCMQPLCSAHKCKRTEYGAMRTHEHIFCLKCAANYDYEQHRKK